MMEFKVGDRVQVVETYSAFRGDKGNVTENDGTDNLPIKVRFDEGNHACWFYEDDLKVLYEEEKVMKFKVGDKVKIGDRVQIYETCSNYYGRCGIVIGDDFCPTFPYKVEFEDGDDCIFKGKDLIVLSTEEETSMKFKVGDKVKVKDSWFGHDGQVGVVFRTDNCGPFNYSVKFDVEGDDGMHHENFKWDSLELAKQQFTKSDLKTGMGVVLRDGTKGHVLLDTVAGDVIRFINEGSNQWGSVDEYDENMIDCDISAMDIVEVYSSKYAYCYLTDRVFNQDCVFKREEPKPEPKPTKMTMKEINEHFGKPIEIVE